MNSAPTGYGSARFVASPQGGLMLWILLAALLVCLFWGIGAGLHFLIIAAIIGLVVVGVTAIARR